MTLIDSPDFYLTSSDSTHFAGVRKCVLEDVVKGSERDDYLLVRIDPPVTDADNGTQLTHVLLAGRHEHFTSVSDRQEVYILKILSKSVFKELRCNNGTVKLIAWGEVIPRGEENATSRAQQPPP